MSSPDTLICIVDDDASIRKSLLRLLKSAGFTAEAFDSAQAYLDRAAHAGPSCVVLDVLMPELTGLGLQQELVVRGRAEPIVFITGDGDIPASVQAMKAGAVDFLSKPFNDAEFLDAVNRALARSLEQRWRHAEREEARVRLAELSPRERQVCQGVIAGKMNKEIADDLGTSIRTIKVQRGSVMKKAGVTSVADLVRLINKAG
jgi:FixJ family two-component response regulator